MITLKPFGIKTISKSLAHSTAILLSVLLTAFSIRSNAQDDFYKDPSPVISHENASTQKSQKTAKSNQQSPKLKFNYDPGIPALAPLPLPSGELSDAITRLSKDLFPTPFVSDYDPAEAAKRRREIGGAAVFEDNERNLYLLAADSYAPRKLFTGSQPAAARSGDKFVYINWSRSSVSVIIYDFKTSSKTTVFSSASPITKPRFSPDGKSISYIVKSLDGSKSTLFATSLSKKKTTRLLVGRASFDYEWNPSDGSIWVAESVCGNSHPASGMCYTRIEMPSGKTTNAVLAVKDPETGSNAPLETLRIPDLDFSPSGNLLLLSESLSADEFYYIIDLNKMTATTKSVSKPDGKTLLFNNVQWTSGGNFVAVNYIGTIWIAPLKDEPPFPLLLTNPIAGPAAWLK
ncbi:MAG TPA: hypothetical protein PLQ76_10100 [bacterium]|nr:hypothetical protein [bacterium]